jgi:hypothetical protein
MERPGKIDICHPPETVLERWLLPVIGFTLIAISIVLLLWSVTPSHDRTPVRDYAPAVGTPLVSAPVALPTTTQKQPSIAKPEPAPAPPQQVSPTEQHEVSPGRDESPVQVEQPEPPSKPSPEPTPETEESAEGTISGRIRVDRDEQGITLIIEELGEEPEVPSIFDNITSAAPEGDAGSVAESREGSALGETASRDAAVEPSLEIERRETATTNPEQGPAPVTVAEQQRPEPGQAQTPAIVKRSVTPSAPPQYRERTIIHDVIKGDTLWDIANRYLNDPWRFPELAQRSGIRNPDLIYPGNRVRVIIRRRVVNE